MLIFSKGLSYLQGEKEAYLGYIFLSPSVFFVGLISCFRGFFQGHMNMYPTALSQIIEQIIKLVFGILLFLSLQVFNADAGLGRAVRVAGFAFHHHRNAHLNRLFVYIGAGSFQNILSFYYIPWRTAGKQKNEQVCTYGADCANLHTA